MRIHARHTAISLILLILTSVGATAQREQNNIYLFDCTWSMKRARLWEPAKEALDATISMQREIPGSEFYVIPFGDEPYEVFSFDAGGYGANKAKIEKAFEDYINKAKYTHITDVLKAGFAKSDPNKENNIYLLTDGEPNGSDSAEKVAETIRLWCTSHRNGRLFYVALTNDVVNPVIKAAIDACTDAFIVQCEGGVIPIIAHISSDVYTNIEELGMRRDLSLSLPGEHRLTVASADSLIDVAIAKAADGKIGLTFSAKNGMSTEDLHRVLEGNDHEFTVLVQFADPRFIIANPEVDVHVADEIPTALELCGGLEEIETEGVHWYDSFLWSNAAPDTPVSWDLAPRFKNQLAQSTVALRLAAADARTDDFEARFNDRPLAPGEKFTIEPGQPAVLTVIFKHDAATGKRYFTLEPAGSSAIDIINGQPAEKYQGTTLRTRYSVDWNPLKTLLFWVGIVLLGLLLLWLIVLKRIFFPVIAVGRVEMAGPGTYLLNKRIKGARRVVFSSKKRSQNVLSRLFTGKILYVRAEHFVPEIMIEAAAGKKKVKVRSALTPSGGWDIYPSTTFRPYKKGTATNRATRESFEIEFS